jgi:DNA mismatch endonuclease, patch repair protein
MSQARRPSFVGLRPASPVTSRVARAASAKRDTRCEVVLRRELWRRGLRYRLHLAELPGRPDIVFPRQKVAVFCDGDFWHGRGLQRRLRKLARGHNAMYWIAKVRRNVERDQAHTQTLSRSGWQVLRFWETDILQSPGEIALRIEEVVRHSRPNRKQTTRLHHQ